MPSFVDSEKLDQIASFEMPPVEALELLRAILGSDEEAAPELVYDTLRSATWKMLTSRIYGDAVEAWYDTFRQVSSLLEAQKETKLSERIFVLAELLLESARFGHANPVEGLILRDHVKEILSTVGGISKNGRVRRALVREKTKLKQSNLTRVLNSMEAVGLIDRQIHGREVFISLTEAGRKALYPGGRTGGQDSPIILDPLPELNMSA